MRREWREVKFFTEKDGRRRPTGLFWWFAGLITIIVVGVGLQIIQKTQEDGDDVTPSATVEVAETDEPEATLTETLEPSPTEYVYDDPSTWEFVLRTDPAGTEYWDLQDWQKEQVWHFFEEFWTLLYRSDEGYPTLDEFLVYLTGEYAEWFRQYYSDLENGIYPGYTYMNEDLNNLPNAILLQSNPDEVQIRLQIVLAPEAPLSVSVRDFLSGEILVAESEVEFGVVAFLLVFEGDQWKIEGSE